MLNNLSTNIRLLLNKKQISENELARRTGVAQQIINRMLSGENQNPKLATLMPLANYFMVSLNQLIGAEPLVAPEYVPLCDWALLSSESWPHLLLQNQERIWVDFPAKADIFATRLMDSSMEPKFSIGSLLILSINKKPISGDFVLILQTNKTVQLRQLIIINSVMFKKCFNPEFADYTLNMLDDNEQVIACLLQSRTNYEVG